jgi:hypothetical protein
MPKNSGNNTERDIDILFTLPLSEFIGARKALATRLKKEGRTNDAEYVTSLAKPPISAWTVNQLYWYHRDEFQELIDAGERFRKAQTSRGAGKVVDMRDALDARREALTELSDLASTLLNDAGHNASLETLRRITTTLEAVSAYAESSGGPSPGRLTKDVDPPGFESLAGFTASAANTKPASVSSSKRRTPVVKVPLKGRASGEPTRLKEAHQEKIAAAKISLQEAKKSLVDARAKAERLEAAQEKADREAKDAEKQKRETEQRFKKASAVAEMAKRRARGAADELDEATKAIDDAKRAIEKATKDLETLFRQSPGK